MKRFLWKCLHEWDILENHEMIRTHINNPRLNQVYFLYILKCKNCGDIKEKTVR